MDSIASHQLQEQNLWIILNCLYLQLSFSPSSFLSVYTHVHFIAIFKRKLSSDQNLNTSDELIVSSSTIQGGKKVISSHMSSQLYSHTLVYCNLTFAPVVHLKWFCPKWPVPAYFLSPLIGVCVGGGSYLKFDTAEHSFLPKTISYLGFHDIIL